MSDLIHAVDSPQEIAGAARQLREIARQKQIAPQAVLEVFERWAAALDDRELHDVPGVTFLRLWLRRGNLEPVLLRELGPSPVNGGWREDGRARLRAFPLGVVGHWPAGNIEIQPILSLTCALLGGNSCLVRVPSGLVQITRHVMEKLQEVDRTGSLTERIFMASFDHSRMDLHEAMAQAVDGAMIWGGAEAVSQVRGLPFPHWARVVVFGPRLSAAAMDAETWGTGLNDLRGVDALRATSGSLISKPAHRRKHFFSSVALDVIRLNSWKTSSRLFKKKTGIIRASKSNRH